MNKKQKNQLAYFLNERWDIYCMLENPADLTFYNGIIKTIETLGYSWERKKDGTHVIY